MQPTLYHHHNYHFFIAFVFEMFIGCLLETPSPNYLICLFLKSSITHRTRVLKQNESVQSQHRTFKNVAEKGRERFRKRLQVRSVNRTLCIVCNTIWIAHISERNQDSPVYFLCSRFFLLFRFLCSATGAQRLLVPKQLVLLKQLGAERQLLHRVPARRLDLTIVQF